MILIVRRVVFVRFIMVIKVKVVSDSVLVLLVVGLWYGFFIIWWMFISRYVVIIEIICVIGYVMNDWYVRRINFWLINMFF